MPSVPGQTYYYGPDQLGTVRRVFASATNAPAYAYDPYGQPLQATAPLTDFVYAGMFYNADSGLDLTQYRAYDPVAGRWLSRDPLGELAGGQMASKERKYGISLTDLLRPLFPNIILKSQAKPSPSLRGCSHLLGIGSLALASGHNTL